MALRYRPEIDGLRAIAIGGVVLYHAGLSSLPGGFTGVDVFFVISGYLITRLILTDVRAGTFSFADFYARRARRILPALFAMVGVVLLLAPAVLLPSQFEHVPDAAIASLAFVANLYFWGQADYFAPASDTLPLLHLWSLGVEEQFYLLAPLLIILVCKWRPRWLGPGLLALVLASFAASVVVSVTHPGAAFYLLPTRAWELGVGSLLALAGTPVKLSRPFREVLAGLGLALILLAFLGLNKAMVFPGYLAAVPVLGTALVIACAPGTGTARLLSQPFFTGLGLISYSLYLWHWPLIVVFTQAGVLDHAAGAVLAVALSALLAGLSWRYLEQPFRAGRTGPRLRLFAGLGVGALGCVLVLFSALQAGTWLFSPQTRAYDQSRYDFSPERARCHLRQGLHDPQALCVLGDVGPRVAVWSDSHGVELGYALARQHRVRLATYSACPPALGFQPAGRPDCAAHNARMIAYFEATSTARAIVLTARFEHWFEEAGFRRGFRAAVSRLRAAGHSVVIVGPMPTPARNVPTALARGADPVFARATPDTRTADIATWLSRLPDVPVVFPADLFCDAATCSMLDRNRNPILFDDNHMSLSAAKWVAREVREALDQQKQLAQMSAVRPPQHN